MACRSKVWKCDCLYGWRWLAKVGKTRPASGQYGKAEAGRRRHHAPIAWLHQQDPEAEDAQNGRLGMTDADDRYDRPNTLPWPPLIYAGSAVLAVVMGYQIPLAGLMPDGTIIYVVGGMLILAGLTLDVAAMATMYRHRANILPHRAATALVTSGVFAVSRNPIYLGNTIFLIGIGLVLGNAWFLPAALAAACAVTHLAIRREEAHLAARFGAAWLAYAARTPRWLWFHRS